MSLLPGNPHWVEEGTKHDTHTPTRTDRHREGQLQGLRITPPTSLPEECLI